jgi:membrane-associated phospholipid phosphatase
MSLPPTANHELPQVSWSRLRERECGLWRTWWSTISWVRRVGPLVGVLLFWALHRLLGGARVDHAALGCAVLLVAYAGPRAEPWFRLLLPMALMGTVYDGQSYVRRALGDRLTIHITEPAAFDRTFFGVHSVAGVLTPAEWLQLHTHPVIDLICSSVYLTFLPAFIGVALWFRWRGLVNAGPTGMRFTRAAESMTWAFFWLGLVSVVTYYLYAAAPPWYAAKYGWGPVVRDALPNAGGAARVDAMLGLPIFATFYGRNPNAFGAIPSLHAAIPLLAFYFACRVGSLRVLTGTYALVMMFSAVYLNHHYVLDLLWGSTYAITIAWLVSRVTAARNSGADRS